jgi:hypothetical protein
MPASVGTHAFERHSEALQGRQGAIVNRSATGGGTA